MAAVGPAISTSRGESALGVDVGVGRHDLGVAAAVRRVDPRKRKPSVGDFEQRGLLAVQVLLRSLDDFDRHAAQPTGGGHLVDRLADASDDGRELGLGADEYLVGVDRMRGDQRAFEDLDGLLSRIVRSLNVPGSPSAALTTTAAATSVDRLSRTVRHFVPVGEPGTAPTAQPEDASDLGDDVVGRHLACLFEADPAAPMFDIGGQVVDGLRSEGHDG